MYDNCTIRESICVSCSREYPTTPEPAKKLMLIIVVGKIGRAATAGTATPIIKVKSKKEKVKRNTNTLINYPKYFPTIGTLLPTPNALGEMRIMGQN